MSPSPRRRRPAGATPGQVAAGSAQGTVTAQKLKGSAELCPQRPRQVLTPDPAADPASGSGGREARRSLPHNSGRPRTHSGHRAPPPARRAKARPPGSLPSSGGGSPGHSKDTRARAVAGAGLTGGGAGRRDGVQEAPGGRGCGTATEGSGEHDGDRSALAEAEEKPV